MKNRIPVFICLLSIPVFAQELPDLTGDYLGQTPPGDSPEVFARGIISDKRQQHGVPAFSPDGKEVFWQTNHQDENGNWIVECLTMSRQKKRWTDPALSPYSSGPSFSSDGECLYFDSEGEGMDPYFLKKQDQGWSDQTGIQLVSKYPEIKYAYNLSVTRDGSLYFLGHAEELNTFNHFGIYRAELINGQYEKPELLPEAINIQGDYLNWTPFISPDERYLIFCSRKLKPEDDYGDLFICFRKQDGSWSDRISLGPAINTKGQERFPRVSPDNKYLFFTRYSQEFDEDVFWVSAKIINDLNKEVFHVQEIHDAASAGDLSKVKMLLMAEPSLLDARDHIEQTPLMKASDNLQLDVAYFLIDKGAAVNARNKYGLSVLCYAMNEDPDCIKLLKRLIEHGADVKMWKGDYAAPMHQALRNNNPEAIKLLVKHGANPNINSDYGTPLQKKLLDHINPNENVSKLLVENGARAVEYSFGNTDLHLAAMVGFAEVCAALVESGADINAKNEYDQMPLFYAARHGHRKAVEVLLAEGADKSAIEESNYGKAPQLEESLRPGEAWLWYLGGMAPGTGYAVKTKNNLLIFDPFLIGDSPDTYLARGNLNPLELAGQKITILLTRKESHPYSPGLEALAKHFPTAEFILCTEENIGACGEENRPPYRLAKANESFSFGKLKIHTIQTRPSTVRSKGNLGYLVEVDGLKIFHAGIHWSDDNPDQVEQFRREIDFLKPFGPVDFAILPAGWHHLGNIDYTQNLYIIDQLSPNAIYYIGDDQVKEEHRRAVSALSERAVPVYYPDGGIAVGQRFHYLRDFYCDYPGQERPRHTPLLFAVEWSNQLFHSSPAFSPDGKEIYWSEIGKDEASHYIVSVSYDNGKWSAPVKTSFSSDYHDDQPFISHDGQTLFFASNRPKIPGGEEKWELWFCTKTEKGWSAPQILNDSIGMWTPTVTHEGTLYFMDIISDAETRGYSENAPAIFRSECRQGIYAQPEMLPENINSKDARDWTPFIAPDESYLIFSSHRAGNYGDGDLYISFRDQHNNWGDPINMGPSVNTTKQERFPGVSPDGKYLFFTRWLGPPHLHDLYWVSTRVIDRLRNAFQEKEK